MEVLGNMQNMIINLGSRMDVNAQEMNGKMQSMGISLQEQMKAGQEEMKAELAKVKVEMQTMDQKMADEICTVQGEMTELKGSVKGVWSAMETGKEEVTDRITMAG